MLERRSRLLGSLIVVASATSASINGPGSRLAYRAGMAPLGLLFWRAAFATAVLVPVVVWRARHGVALVTPGAVPSRDRAALALAALATLSLNVTIFIAFERMTVALALLTYYSYPAMVTVAVAALHRERPSGGKLAALVMALCGVALVVGGQLDPAGGLAFDLIGFLMALAAAVSQTVFVVVTRRGYASVPTEQAATLIVAFTAVSYLLLAAVGGAMAQVAVPFEHGSVWPLILLIGVVGSGLSFLLYVAGVRWIGGMRTAILAMFEPVVAVALAALLLGERLQPTELAGGLLVLGAGVVLQRTPEPVPAEAAVLGPAGAGTPRGLG